MTTIEDAIHARNNETAITAALGGFLSSSLSVYLFKKPISLERMAKIYTIAGTTLFCAIWGKNISRTPKTLDQIVAIPLTSAPILGLWLAYGPSPSSLKRFAVPLAVLALISAAIPWATAEAINEQIKVHQHNNRIFIWNGPLEREHSYLRGSTRVFGPEPNWSVWSAQKLEWISRDEDIKDSEAKAQIKDKTLTCGEQIIDLPFAPERRAYTQVEETDKETIVTIFNGKKSLIVTFAN